MSMSKTYWIVLPDGAAYDMTLARGKAAVGYLDSGAIFEALAKGDPSAGIDKVDLAKVLDGQETIGYLLGGKRARALAEELSPSQHPWPWGFDDGVAQYKNVAQTGDGYTFQSTFWSRADSHPFATFAFLLDSHLSSRALQSSSWVDFLILDGKYALALAVDGIDPVFDHMYAREFSRRGRASGRVSSKKGLTAGSSKKLTNVKIYDRYFGIEEALNGRKSIKLADIESAEAVRDILDQIVPSRGGHYSDPLDIELTVKRSQIDDYGPGGQRVYTVDVTFPARKK